MEKYVPHMESVIIYDEYEQPWRIYSDEPRYEEAKQNVEEANGEKVHWPLMKLTEGRGYGWWVTYQKIDGIEKELTAMGILDPSKYRLIDPEHQYTPDELRSLLQRFGSFLSNLHAIEQKLVAQNYALKEGLKTGLKVTASKTESKAKSVGDRDAEILSSNELLLETRRLEIDTGSLIELVSGWRKSYESAYATTSRLITLLLGEAAHLGGNG